MFTLITGGYADEILAFLREVSFFTSITAELYQGVWDEGRQNRRTTLDDI